MQDKIFRKFFLGFIQTHILHHAKSEPVYGVWMIEELRRHGYDISPGTLYPILHGLESSGLLVRQERIVDGKVRKYYSTTDLGMTVLIEVKKRASELFKEIKDK